MIFRFNRILSTNRAFITSSRKIQSSYANVEKRKKAGYTPEEATNLTGIELVSAAEAHCRAFLIQSGYEMIEKVTRNLSPALTVVLKQLGELYAVDACIRASGDLLRVRMENERLYLDLSLMIFSISISVHNNDQ